MSSAMRAEAHAVVPRLLPYEPVWMPQERLWAILHKGKPIFWGENRRQTERMAMLLNREPTQSTTNPKENLNGNGD